MIHHRNLQFLAVEIYKALHNMSPSFMSELFQIKGMRFTLRKGETLVSYNIKTEKFGKQSISYLAPIIWGQVPEDIKKIDTLVSFKKKIKQWIPEACPCSLCKTYVSQVGYI